MRKIFPVITATLLLIVAQGCGGKSEQAPADGTPSADATADSLRAALANADSMYALLYDVTVGLDQIARLEHLLQTEINNEDPTTRTDIMQQMQAIQRGLAERRQRIAELEDKLRRSAGDNAALHARINDLRTQVDNQAAHVRELTDRLARANFRIGELQDSIAGLTASVDSIAMQQADTEQELTRTLGELNTVYYVIGSAGELKNHGFKQGGTIFKKSRLGNDFDVSYMTRADRRTLSSIPLDAKKAKVLSEQPESSYTLQKDAYGMLTLVITDPETFWALRDFLVIEVK